MPIIAVVGAVLALPLAYLSAVAVAAADHGYTWAEMDWNSDGHTNIGEFFSAADIGRRDVTKGSSQCHEYFAYKDGLPIRIDCPAG